jgi:parallel beta-helix repeat protein
MKVKMTIAVLAIAGFTIGVVAPASAWQSSHVTKVRPGQSIQAAINAAHPGDTIKLKPGTYRENVQIKTNDIQLIGSGAGSTKIEPAATPAPVCGATASSVNGICVADADSQGNIISKVSGVRISDLSVSGFPGVGIFFLGANGADVHDTLAADNTDYGIAAFVSTNGKYRWNDTPRNGEAGIYLGDSPEAHSIVQGNTSWANRGFGIFIRDSSFGEVSGNRVFDNCTGIIFLNTGSGEAHWLAKNNRAVTNNSAACPGDPAQGEDPLSGIGIAVAGATDITIHQNVALNNQPGGPSPVSGGIAVAQGASNVTVSNNTAFGNLPTDLVWDGTGTGNQFVGNACATSNPPGLCATGQGGGNGGNGGDQGGHGGKHHKHHGKRHKHHH